MFFRKLEERELSYKTKKPKDVCFVAFADAIEIIKEDKIRALILGESQSKDLLINHTKYKAYKSEDEAKANIINYLIKNPIGLRYGITEPSADLKSLPKNAFWILTVEGKVKQITQLLKNSFGPTQSADISFQLFCPKIILAKNINQSIVLSAAAIREQYQENIKTTVFELD